VPDIVDEHFDEPAGALLDLGHATHVAAWHRLSQQIAG
jgi:hypothetical protein